MDQELELASMNEELWLRSGSARMAAVLARRRREPYFRHGPS
jgi:hypothetical protein